MRRSWPQMPIRKYMGTSETSQKTKNKNKSSAQKTPINPNSSRSKKAKNSLTCFSMERHETRTQMGVSSVDRMINQRLMPSMAT